VDNKPVTILLYHGVDSGEGFYKCMEPRLKEYILSKNLFEEHMAYIHANGYKVCLLNECLSRPAGDKEVILTFDDGEKSCYTAITPILERYGFKGEFFVISSFIGKPYYMTIDDLRDLSKRGHSIQSHSMRHLFLTELDTDSVIRELKKSKADIESITEKDVLFFSIPRGPYDKRVLSEARKAGYKAVLCSVEGYNKMGQGKFLFKRFGMRSYTQEETLAGIIGYKPMTRLRLFLKTILTRSIKAVCSDNFYNRIRDRFFVKKVIKINRP